MSRIDCFKQEEFNIVRIKEAEEKCFWSPSLRSLWRECFGDPPDYEEFYFSRVYPGNVVYAIENKGMLHLNPYISMVQGREILLHYIVGVASKPSERRKGIMRSLLINAMKDMYERKTPFTYLMPANVQYYEPFDFTSLYEKQEKHFKLRRQTEYLQNMSPVNPDVTGLAKPVANMKFVAYHQFMSEWSVPHQLELYGYIGKMLERHYCMYAVHDRDYFDLLYQEKCCQSGNVVFCFIGETSVEYFAGFFAYGMDGKDMYIEQQLFQTSFSERDVEQCLYEYCWNLQRAALQCKRTEHIELQPAVKDIHIINQFPYMVRIVHMESFLQLFREYFAEFVTEKKALRIRDSILSENEGSYLFFMENNEIRIQKQIITDKADEGWIEKNANTTVTMSVGEVADYVWQQMKEARKQIFFAEVV